MATSPKEIKKLLDLLIERRTLPFDDVLAIFAGKNGKVNKAAVMERLNFLCNENLFVLLDPQGAEASWNEDTPFQTPAAYTLRFVGLEGRENVSARSLADTIDTQDIQEVVPGYVWAGLKRREALRIIGDPSTATLLAERLRAFTHQFAFHLAARHTELIADMFSTNAKNGQTLQTLLARVHHLEAEYGRFDYFDHVRVIQVLNGDISKLKDADGFVRMDLPKSIPRESLRGWTEFQIISVRTPHGVYIHEMTVSLKVVEENGFFHIADATVASGY